MDTQPEPVKPLTGKAAKTVAPTVEVNKEQLDKLLAQLQTQGQQIEMLVATADKARVARYNDLNQSPTTHSYRVRMFKGKLVVGWRSVLDEMYQDGHGQWHERQQVEIVTEDGEKFTLPFLESERLEKLTATYIGTEIRMENGQTVTTLGLRMPDGREIKIDQVYVN